MKLLIQKPRVGASWVKSGIRTFWQRPMAMMGLFFLMMAVLSVLNLMPIIGSLLALAMMPAATVGLMAASREVVRGKFPMPHLLLVGFKSGPHVSRQLLILGGLYAAGFLLALGGSALMDGGNFAKLYLFGGELTEATIQDPNFELAVIVAGLLFLPVSMLFWHAPALVAWQGVSWEKSLFFSAVASLRNFWAFAVYALVWGALFIAMGMVVSLTAVLLGEPKIQTTLMFPATLLMAAMFFSSIYFSYLDCFESTLTETP